MCIIQIYIIVFFIGSLLNLLFNKNRGVLSCGLFGFSGNGEPPDMARIKILGLYNQDRGKHSCGFYYDGYTLKGVGKDNALWQNFIINNVFESVEGSNIFIGHTRHATYGEHTVKNAHPFIINDHMIVAHNGTISNIWELCAKYGIDHTNIKVDSEALGYLLDKEGAKVLEEYRGAAALLVHKEEEPNSMYIYHGASREKKDGEIVEERPLFMLKVDNGIYFSSLRCALEAIRYNEKQIPERVPHNKVIKITNGKITKVQINIPREDVNIPVVYPVPKKVSQVSPASNNGYGTAIINSAFEEAAEEKEIIPHIWYETIPNKAFEEKDEIVYFHQGRYWKTFTDKGNSTSELCHGLLFLDKKGYIYPVEQGSTTKFYFWRGVLLQSEKLYTKILEDDALRKELDDNNFACIISKYSRYPVTNLESESTHLLPHYRFRWYRSSVPEKSGFTPLWGNRNYCFKEGLLTKITCNDSKEAPLLKIPDEVLNPPKKDKELKLTDTKNYSEYSKKVNESMLFFEQVWASKPAILTAMTRLCEVALRNYIKDSYIIHDEKELTEQEITNTISNIFDDAVKDGYSIEEFLPLTGNLRDYLQSALDKVNGRTEDYVLTDGGIYIPAETKDSQETEDKDSLPFSPSTNEEKCLACAGLGISSKNGVCKPCGGTGRKKKEEQAYTPPLLFTDAELNYGAGNDDADEAEANSCRNTFEKVTDKGEQDKMLEDASACDFVRDNVIPDIRDTISLADEFQAMLNSEFAQEIAYVLYKQMDEMTAKLKETFIKFGQGDLVKEINKKTVLA